MLYGSVIFAIEPNRILKMTYDLFFFFADKRDKQGHPLVVRKGVSKDRKIQTGVGK
jgi:hypothetical protein